MSKADVLKKLNKALNKGYSLDFSEFDKNITELKENLRKEVNIATLEDVKVELSKFKKKLDLTPLTQAVTNLGRDFNEKQKNLSQYVEFWVKEIERLIQEKEGVPNEKLNKLDSEISALKSETFNIAKNVRSTEENVSKEIEKVSVEIKSIKDDDFKQKFESKLKNTETFIQEKVEKNREELLGYIGNLPKGGNAQRQINIRSSIISSKYTDINFANSTTIGWTASDDDTNKRVNIVASLLSGGGGSGTPGGDDTEVQFNDGGAFDGEPGLTFNKNTSILTATNTIISNTLTVDVKNDPTIPAIQGDLDPNTGIDWAGSDTLNLVTGGARAIRLTPSQIEYNDSETDRNHVFWGTGTNRVIQIDAGNNRVGILTGASPENIKNALDVNGAVVIGNAFAENLTAPSNGLAVQGEIDIGQQGSTLGAIRLMGASTGYVQLQTASIAGSWNLTFPTNDGSAGQYLLTDGNGITQWASVTAAGGSGITRSTSIITANTTGADTASTDYMYFCNAGITFTLPTAVSNTNLYTIKNMVASSVLVATTDGQVIDGSATALMSSQYESLSLLSNNSVWGVV